MKKLFTFFLGLALCGHILAQETAKTATFEELTVPESGYYTGTDVLGMKELRSGDFLFLNISDTSGYDWDGVHYVSYYWNGWGYANLTDREYDTDPYSDYDRNSFINPVGGGAGGSSIYALGYASEYSPAIVKLAAEAQVLQGAYFVNDVLAIDRIHNGDNFGCSAFKTGDYAKITVTGFSGGEKLGETDIYLADYRSEKEEDHYYLNEWTWFDLSALGKVDSLTFVAFSSQANQYGNVFPQYFCMDNFNCANPAAANRVSAAALSLRLFPVPARESLTVATTENNYKLEILNLSGRCVYSASCLSGVRTLNVAGWENGMYILRLTAASGTVVTRKFVVAR